MLRLPVQQWSRKPRQPKAISSERLKLLAPQPSEILRPKGPPRLRHSKENMTTSCRIWRHKSSNRSVEAKLTSSPPARLLSTPVHQSSRVPWPLPTTSYWDRHLYHLHLFYHRGLPQCRNNPFQSFLPCQCPSSLLGPKDGTLPQILWRACLWVEPLWRWLWENQELQAVRDPTLVQSTLAKLHWGIWPGLWLGKGSQEGILLKTFLQSHHRWHLQSLRYI